MREEFKKYWQNEPKNALITGASSGMGLCYAKYLASKGYNLYLISIQEKELADVANTLKEQYPNQKFIYITIDLAQADAAEKVVAFSDENAFNVSLLINNAGIFSFKDVLDLNIKVVETYIGLHMTTITKLCIFYSQKMKEQGGGRILNVSSISAHTPFAGIAMYSATKSYLLNFTKAFALEVMDYNIKVSAVCPGAVATGLYKLSLGLQKLGVCVGVIMTPERLVKKALRANERGIITIIPGIGNRLFKPVFGIIPKFLKKFIRRRIKNLDKKF